MPEYNYVNNCSSLIKVTPFYMFLIFTLSSLLNRHTGSAVCVPTRCPRNASTPLPHPLHWGFEEVNCHFSGFKPFGFGIWHWLPSWLNWHFLVPTFAKFPGWKKPWYSMMLKSTELESSNLELMAV